MKATWLLFGIAVATNLSSKTKGQFEGTHKKLEEIRNKIVSKDIANSEHTIDTLSSPREKFEDVGASLGENHQVVRTRIRSEFPYANGCMSWMFKRFVDYKYPKTGVICVKGVPLTATQSHPLMKEYSYLKFLKNKRVAVNPVFLSGSTVRDNHVYRYMIVKKPGVSLQEYLGDKQIALVSVVKVGVQLARTLERLHNYGISHGNVCLDTVFFCKGRDIERGFVLGGFEKAFSTSEGLSIAAIEDLKGMANIMGLMQRLVFDLMHGRGSDQVPAVTAEYFKELFSLIFTIRSVAEIDYPKIRQVLLQCYRSLLHI